MPLTPPTDIAELNEMASRPNQGVLDTLDRINGDILVLGAGGKMGFHLSRMLQRGLEQLDSPHRVLAISRFGSPGSTDAFRESGIETVAVDLTEPENLKNLPDSNSVFYLAGVKFGTANEPELLHRMNVEMPQRVAQRYQDSRIVALSTGCVYSFVDVSSGGSTESDPLDPPGAYAESCKQRELAFANQSVATSLIRLNYSVDLRYGVLVDLALNVFHGCPIDLSTGYFNVIWQGDANRYIIQAIDYASDPPFLLNVTGTKIMRVRDVAERFSDLFGKPLKLTGEESETAWLNDASKAHSLFGDPEIPEDSLVEWVATWIQQGGELLNKPTHFEVRDGQY